MSYGHSNSSLDEILKCDFICLSYCLFMLEKVVLDLSLDAVLECSHLKAIEQYFLVLLIIVLSRFFSLSLESVDRFKCVTIQVKADERYSTSVYYLLTVCFFPAYRQ